MTMMRCGDFFITFQIQICMRVVVRRELGCVDCVVANFSLMETSIGLGVTKVAFL